MTQLIADVLKRDEEERERLRRDAEEQFRIAEQFRLAEAFRSALFAQQDARRDPYDLYDLADRMQADAMLAATATARGDPFRAWLGAQSLNIAEFAMPTTAMATTTTRDSTECAVP